MRTSASFLISPRARGYRLREGIILFGSGRRGGGRVGRRWVGVGRGQIELERGARAGLALHGDLSAVRFDEPLRNGQPEPGAALAIGSFDLEIPIEDPPL